MVSTCKRSGMSSLVVALTMSSVTHSEATAQSAPVPVIGRGELKSLSILPDKVVLRGADQIQQLVVTGEYANGGVRDLTTQASYRSDDPRIVRIGNDGLLFAVGNGTCQVTAEAQGSSVKLTVAVEGAEQEQPINFANEIVPIFSKLGCNAGGCHGKASGQNGFKLSILGFDPRADYEAIARESRARRVFPAAADASLILRKPTGALPHGGGKRLKVDSRDYQVLLRWIRSGMPYGRDSDPKVVGITLTPNHRMVLQRSSQQIVVSAHYSDRSQRDVTRQAEYSSNDTEIVESNEGGLILSQDRPGSGAVMVRHLGHVAAFRATIPQEVPPEKFVQPPAAKLSTNSYLPDLRNLACRPRGCVVTANSCGERPSTSPELCQRLPRRKSSWPTRTPRNVRSWSSNC